MWEDYTSGPPITSQMLAGKLDIGVMGDYPLLVNIARFQETNSLRSVIVSMTGYNMNGSGNSIVVPADAPIYRFEDLKGKKVSVPFGSAAHGMLLKALVDRGLGQEFFTLINQAPPIGATSVQEKKIDAHADFCPWGELMEFKGFGRKIFDGSQASVAYLHGPVVRKDFLEKYPEIVVAYLKAVVEANEWITKNPEEATTKQEQWTSIPKEVLYLYFGRGGFLTLDATIKPKWVEVLKYDASVLQKMGIIKGADVEGFIDDRFVKQAYRELGRDYAREQRLMVAGTSPMEGKDASTGAAIKDPRAAAEMWLKGEPIKPYALAGELDGCPAGGRAGGPRRQRRVRVRLPDGPQALRPSGVLRRGRQRQGRHRVARRVRLEGRSRGVRDQERRQGPLARGSEEAGGRQVVATAPLVGAPAAPADAAVPLATGAAGGGPRSARCPSGSSCSRGTSRPCGTSTSTCASRTFPSPGDVLAEAIALFSSPGFYVHILASLERIWLGFAIATVLGVGLGLAHRLVRGRRGHPVPAHRAAPSDPGGGLGADQHHALAHRAVEHRIHHDARRVLPDRAQHDPRRRGHRPTARARRHEPGRGTHRHLPRGRPARERCRRS